jgi:hypothetical protein
MGAPASEDAGGFLLEDRNIFFQGKKTSPLKKYILARKKNFSSQEVLKPGLTLAPIVSRLPMLLSRQTSSCSCILGMSLHHPGMTWSYLSVATVLAAVAVLVDYFTSLIVK